MIFNFFSRYYPIILFKKTPKTLQKDQKTKTSNLNFTNTIIPDQSKVYSEGKDPKKTGKEEELQVKMPGFIPPDSMNEEGYFTQKAKQQLEELKRRGLEKPTYIKSSGKKRIDDLTEYLIRVTTSTIRNYAVKIYKIKLNKNECYTGLIFVSWKNFLETARWYSKSKDGPAGAGSVRQSGGGMSKLDSANEDGFFFKLNKSRLEKLKKMMKNKESI